MRAQKGRKVKATTPVTMSVKKVSLEWHRPCYKWCTAEAKNFEK